MALPSRGLIVGVLVTALYCSLLFIHENGLINRLINNRRRNAAYNEASNEKIESIAFKWSFFSAYGCL